MILALDVAIVVISVGILGLFVGFYIDGEARIRRSYPPCNRCGRRVGAEGISYFDGRHYHFGCDSSQQVPHNNVAAG